MKKAWENLDYLEKWRDKVKAETYHDLCRTQEVYNMLSVGRCMITAAMYRQESRFGQSHNRLDFPDTDDEHWLGQVIIEKNESGTTEPSFTPLKYK